MKVKYCPSTQKQYNGEYAVSLEKWRDSKPNNPNGITANDVQQHLTLDQEPDATVTVSNLNAGASLINNPGWSANQFPKIYKFNNSVNGALLTVTYTNLKHSKYVDENGNTHSISKIVRTFSDGISNGLGVFPDKKGTDIAIGIRNDPSYGFGYYGMRSITTDDVYYDENGNPINISDNSGYLAVTSLNALYESNGQMSRSGTQYQVERVKPLQRNEKAYSLAGSSINVHSDGSLYADATNDSSKDFGGNTIPKGISTWPDSKKSWDRKGDNEYYGAGIVSLSGTHHTLQWSNSMGTSWLSNGWTPVQYVWATMQTILPETPKPQPKTTSIHYHYDVFGICGKHEQ